MSARENAAVAAILTDPENQNRSAEEVAQRVLDALASEIENLRAEEIERVADRVIEAVEGEREGGIPVRVLDAIDNRRARTHRFAVVGQIAFHDAPETAHTAVLGPFSTRGVLDTQDKFLRALERTSAARNAGQDLRWDIKTGRGRGRFMLAPAFRSARDAWNFFRPAEPDIPKRFQWIAESIQRWEAGGSREHAYGPVCHCGTQPREHQTSAGPVMTGPCPVHGGGAR